MEGHILMREPCKACGCHDGRIDPKNGQNVVRCRECGRHCYNAPKVETGEVPRSATTVHNGIKPKQRARILERATGRCELCGNPGAKVPLHVGHLLSVESGLTHGYDEQVLNNDENLAAMCEECNLGLGGQTVSVRLIYAILLRRVRG